MIDHHHDPFEVAGDWLLRAELGLTDAEAARLEAWLAADPAHRTAYEAVLETHEGLERLADDEALDGLRRAALRAGPSRRWSPLAVAASVLLAVAVLTGGGWWAVGSGGPLEGGFRSRSAPAVRYVTAVGERASITLADGSVLELNTDSAAEVVLDRDERRVRLLRGQALFTVAHDPDRPFNVLAGERRVTALGTVFDVLMLSGDLRVAMLEGAVRVSPEAPSPGAPVSPRTLSAGEVMTARADGAVSIRRMDTARLADWRDGVVYFEDTPLSEAVAEMNRYARAPITVEGARVGALRVSGAFRTAEADAFAGAMADILPVRIRRSVGGSTVLTDAGA